MILKSTVDQMKCNQVWKETVRLFPEFILMYSLDQITHQLLLRKIVRTFIRFGVHCSRLHTIETQ